MISSLVVTGDAEPRMQTKNPACFFENELSNCKRLSRCPLTAHRIFNGDSTRALAQLVAHSHIYMRYTRVRDRSSSTMFSLLSPHLVHFGHFALGILSCAAIYAFLKFLRPTPPTLPLPPGPKPLPLLGNLLDVPLTRQWLVYSQWAERYGI